MKLERLKGFVKFSLAHHPLCVQLRPHTIQIGGINLCLGCTGFYGGISIGILVVVITWNLFRLEWLSLVVISTVMFLPTILRLINIPFFFYKEKISKIIIPIIIGFWCCYWINFHSYCSKRMDWNDSISVGNGIIFRIRNKSNPIERYVD
ncbi:MAG: hypothetical protein ACFFDT_38170 [Candidatus Hodarchaeota archaeon]